MTTQVRALPTQAQQQEVQRFACINAVHAQTYDNPACMTCQCAWKPPAVRTLRRIKERDRA